MLQWSHNIQTPLLSLHIIVTFLKLTVHSPLLINHDASTTANHHATSTTVNRHANSTTTHYAATTTTSTTITTDACLHLWSSGSNDHDAPIADTSDLDVQTSVSQSTSVRIMSPFNTMWKALTLCLIVVPN